jgi:hypothetical protein
MLDSSSKSEKQHTRLAEVCTLITSEQYIQSATKAADRQQRAVQHDAKAPMESVCVLLIEKRLTL